MTQLFRRLAPSLAALALIACDRPFLHDVPLVKPPSTCPQIAPPELVLDLGSAGVELAWKQPAELNFQGFRIERWQEGEGWVNLQEINGDQLSYTDATVQRDARYLYRMRGTRAGCADLPATDEVEIFSLPKDPQVIQVGSQTQTSLELQWADNNDNEASYRLQGNSEDDSTWVTLVDALVASSSTVAHTHSGLSPDTCYSYRVAARRQGAVVGSEFEFTASAQVDACTLPLDPTELRVDSASPNAMHLVWVDSNQHPTLFRVQRFDSPCDSVSSSASGSADVSQARYSAGNLLADTIYCFRVHSVHAINGQDLVSPGYAQVQAITPGDPVTGLSTSAQSETSIRLDWSNSNTHTTAFVVERSPFGQNSFVVLAEGIAPAQLFFSDSLLSGNTRYDYRVYARNNGGDSQPAEVSGWTLPFAPDSVTVRAQSTTELLVSWVDTRNSYVDGYRVERSLAGQNSFTRVGDFASAPMQHSDAYLDVGTAYDYRVAAFVDPASPILSPGSVASGGTTHNPVLIWGANPSLSAACHLIVPGVSVLDSRASYDSASASVGHAASGSMSADEAGFRGTLSVLDWGLMSTTWSVTDDMGGDTTVERELEIGFAASSVVRHFSATPAFNSATGRQVWSVSNEPDPGALFAGRCATCAGLPGVLARGNHFGCALDRSGELRCWGQNEKGQLGNGDSNQVGFGAVCGTSCSVTFAEVKSVAAGYAHACAANGNGEVYCWGADETNQLGHADIGDSVESSAEPLQVYVSGSGTGLNQVVAVAVAGYAGAGHSCAITKDPKLYCWGDNSFGQLGLGTTGGKQDVATLITTPGLIATVALGAIGGNTPAAHSCSLNTDRGVHCWGSNSDGQLGIDSVVDSDVPAQVCVDAGCTSPLSNAIAIAAGGAHSCAVLNTGQVRCWGRNISGQIGDGETGGGNNRTVATTVCASGSVSGGDCVAFTGAAAITAGSTHTCALKAVDGSVWCWGGNDSLQLGNGDATTNQPNPVPVCRSGASAVGDCNPLVDAVAVVAGSASTCALMPSGQALCWGFNYGDVLGNAGVGDASATPLQVCISGDGVDCANGELYSSAALRACGPVEVRVP